jgi:hypothetical protein
MKLELKTFKSNITYKRSFERQISIDVVTHPGYKMWQRRADVLENRKRHI